MDGFSNFFIWLWRSRIEGTDSSWKVATGFCVAACIFMVCSEATCGWVWGPCRGLGVAEQQTGQSKQSWRAAPLFALQAVYRKQSCCCQTIEQLKEMAMQSLMKQQKMHNYSFCHQAVSQMHGSNWFMTCHSGTLSAYLEILLLLGNLLLTSENSWFSLLFGTIQNCDWKQIFV